MLVSACHLLVWSVWPASGLALSCVEKDPVLLRDVLNGFLVVPAIKPRGEQEINVVSFVGLDVGTKPRQLHCLRLVPIPELKCENYHASIALILSMLFLTPV